MNPEQAEQLEHPDMEKPAANALFQRARSFHERGVLADAERVYRDALSVDPQHVDALHLLGVLHFQTGRAHEADALIRRAIGLQPSALAFAHHGAVLAALGRRVEAIDCFDAALALNPQQSDALLRRANTLFEMKRHADALIAYDRLLELVPTSLDALCNRGAALRGLGRHADALASYDRALALDAQSAQSFATHCNRANLLRELRRYDDALAGYERALALRPEMPELLSIRGMTLIDLGRDKDALTSFNEAIAVRPDFVEALYNSSVALERLARFAEALSRCERILAIEPDHAKALANRGNVLQKLKRYADAIDSYDRALAVEPHNGDVLCNRGSALRFAKRFDEALHSYDAALAQQPELVDAWTNRANVLQDLHRYDDALASHDRALALAPSYALAWFNRGNTLQMMSRDDDALQAYRRAVEADPDYADAHCAQGFLHLRNGALRTGWQAYEWRWRDPKNRQRRREFAQPLWLGEAPLAGRTILLHAEQGFGDTLQFCRYVPHVKALGATVVLEVQPALKMLLGSLAGVDRLIAQGEPLPPFDLHCPLLSLPLALRTDTLADIPAATPYLHTDAALAMQWRDTLGPRAARVGLRVGLAWSGNPEHLNDINRSLDVAALRPLFDIEGIEWISLQKLVREADDAALAASPVRQFGSALRDFADTAALVQQLDVVIAVDTSVAHLAGALGRPVWLLLPFMPDWRWLTARRDSPWYPHATLFRQRAPGEWRDPLEQIAAELKTELKTELGAKSNPHVSRRTELS